MAECAKAVRALKRRPLERLNVAFYKNASVRTPGSGALPLVLTPKAQHAQRRLGGSSPAAAPKASVQATRASAALLMVSIWVSGAESASRGTAGGSLRGEACEAGWERACYFACPGRSAPVGKCIARCACSARGVAGAFPGHPPPADRQGRNRSSGLRHACSAATRRRKKEGGSASGCALLGAAALHSRQQAVQHARAWQVAAPHSGGFTVLRHASRVCGFRPCPALI